MIAALLGLLAILVLGGSASVLSDACDRAKKAIPDKARREIVVDVAKALERDIKDADKRLGKHFEEFIAVHVNYDSTEADFDAVAVKLKEVQESVAGSVVSSRDRMRTQMTRKEWDTVFPKLPTL